MVFSCVGLGADLANFGAHIAEMDGRHDVSDEPTLAPASSYVVDRTTGSGWDDLLQEFRDATYDQSHIYASEMWGAERLSTLELRVDGSTVAAAQIVVLTAPGLGHGLAYVKFGPLWKRKSCDADVRHLGKMLAALKQEYVERRGHMLCLLPPPCPGEEPVWQAELARAGLHSRRILSDPNRYLVRLDLDEEGIRAGLAQKWRYNLKRAGGAGLSFEKITGLDGLAAFDPLYRQMVDRKQFDDVTGYDAVARMIQSLPESARPVAYLGRHRGQPVAGALVGHLGDTAAYLFGASADDALTLRAGYALQWHVAMDMRTQGARWYDLGGEAGEPGLRQFKKGFVGKTGAVHVLLGEHEVWAGPAGRIGGDAIFAARRLRAQFRALRSLRRRWSQ